MPTAGAFRRALAAPKKYFTRVFRVQLRFLGLTHRLGIGELDVDPLPEVITKRAAIATAC